MDRVYWIADVYSEFRLVRAPNDAPSMTPNVVIDLPGWMETLTFKDASFLKWLLDHKHLTEDTIENEPPEILQLEFSLEYLDEQLARNQNHIDLVLEKLESEKKLRESLSGERFLTSQKLKAFQNER